MPLAMRLLRPLPFAGRRCGASIGSQKLDHQRIDPFGNLGLNPMACIGYAFQLELGNPRFESFGQAEAQIAILLAPDQQRGFINARDGMLIFQWIGTKQRTVVILLVPKLQLGNAIL